MQFVPKVPIKYEYTESVINDIKEYFGFETSKLTMISETNQGLKMAGGKQTYIPVIYVSNVDGYCLDVVKQVVMTVEPRDLWSTDENASSIVKYFETKLKLGEGAFTNKHIGSTFYIDNAYNVNGVGLVISGINRGDKISVNDDLYIGPINKEFIKVKIRSIHNDDRKSIDRLLHHHRGCIAIKPLKSELKKSQIFRGMVMISNPLMIKNVCYRVNAAVTIFGDHSATLRTGYSPVIHAGTIRQEAKLILPIDEKQATDSALSKHEHKENGQHKIKAGDVDRVTFKFRMRPEYVDPGTVFVFRTGELHGIGCVIDVIPLDKDADAQPEPIKRKFRKSHRNLADGKYKMNTLDKIVVVKQSQQVVY